MEMYSLLKKAKKIEPLIKLDILSPTEVYNKLILFSKKQSAYFDLFSPKEFLILVILIYSLKKTGEFKLAEKIFTKMYFCNFIVNTGDNADEPCHECSGDGYVDCSDCDGSGLEDCYDCSGNGSVNCKDCGGDGQIICELCDGSGQMEDDEECPDCNGAGSFDCETCSGDGDVECKDCDGEGKQSCSYCDGGSRSCSECYGDGEVQSDDKYRLNIIEICSWDEELNSVCELKIDTETPIMKEDEILEKNNIIVLSINNEEGELDFDLEAGEAYCYSFEKNPRLKKYINGKITPDSNYTDWSYYTNA